MFSNFVSVFPVATIKLYCTIYCLPLGSSLEQSIQQRRFPCPSAKAGYPDSQDYQKSTSCQLGFEPQRPDSRVSGAAQGYSGLRFRKCWADSLHSERLHSPG